MAPGPGTCRRTASLALATLASLTAGVPRAAGGEASATPAEATSVWVEAVRGRLSVALDGAPLEAVLAAIRAETGVAVTVYGPIARDVSDRFRGLSLEAALRRLLRPLNVAFVYGPPRGAAPARLEKVVVCPAARASRGPAEPADRPAAAPRATVPAEPRVETAATAETLPPEAASLARLAEVPAADRPPADRATATREVEALLRHADPAVRRQALEVAETTRLASADALRQAALTDADLQVRWAALAALVATAGRDAAVRAAESGLASASAGERLAALEALGEQLGGEVGERAARRALADPDPAVRAKAVEIVAIVEEGERLAPEDEETADVDDGAEADAEPADDLAR